MRKTYIEILNEIAACQDLPKEYGSNASLQEIQLVADLIDKDCLAGDYVRNEVGIPCTAIVTGITIEGRQFADQLEDEQYSKSFTSRFMACLKYFGVFLAGIIGTLITQYLLKKLKLDERSGR